MYVSQTGAAGTGGGVVVASGMAQQTHSAAVVVPHGTTVQQHSAVTHHHSSVSQQHGTVVQQHATVLQPQQMVFDILFMSLLLC